MWMIQWLCLMIGGSFPLDVSPGGALVQDGVVVVTLPGEHRVLFLGSSLTPFRSFGSFGDGPEDLNVPSGIFLGPGRNLWIFNLGNRSFTVLDGQDHRFKRKLHLKEPGIPLSQSGKDPQSFGFLSGWEEIYRLYRHGGKDRFHLVRKGGRIGKANRKIGRFFQDHLLLPFANGKVLWADCLDLDIYLDDREIVALDPTHRPVHLPKDPFQFQKILPELDRFHMPGCFTFEKEGVEVAVVTLINSIHADMAFRVLFIDEKGTIRFVDDQQDYPLAIAGDRLLMCNEALLYWSKTPQGLHE